MDGFHCYGFPFLVWSEGGIAGTSEFSRAALWGNLAVAVLISTLVAVFFRRHARHA